ncbi:ATP-binding protein [Candidatus Poribacteria bacterium]
MFNLSLGFKIIAFVIVIFIAFAYFNFRAEKKQTMERSKRTAELLSIAIYGSLSEAMLEGPGKTQKVQKMLESYGSVEEIDRIRIFNPKSKIILVDADEASIGFTVDQRYNPLLEDLDNGDSRSELFADDGKPVLATVIPIMNGPKCYQCHESQERVLGAIGIDVSVTDTLADIARSRFRIIWFALLTAIIASLIIMLLIIYFVNRPVKELTTAMNKVESGDLAADPHVPVRSDLGKLGESFNSMSVKLRRDIERLESLNETAELLRSRIETADEELREKVVDLTEVRSFNDSILQNMSNGLITTDMDGRIVYFNSAAEAILGYRAQEVQRQPMKGLFSNLESLASETLRGNTGFTFHETDVVRKTGSDIPIEVSTSLLKDDSGRATGVIMIFTDLTERREMETQIRRADRLATLGQLATGVAHEIRNPLAGISGAVQILRDDTSKDDQQREILGDIIERINRLNTAISNFLRFARPAPLQLSPVDMNEVVQSVLFLMNKQAETQGISIIEEHDDNLPIVMADSEQMQQVILNIALNALQAIGEDGGQIIFRVLQNDAEDQIVVEISDTGSGISAENLDQIFDPYFTSKSEGTGLGLSIAQGVVEEHGGSISVESEVGKGTTFRVRLRHGQDNYSGS